VADPYRAPNHAPATPREVLEQLARVAGALRSVSLEQTQLAEQVAALAATGGDALPAGGTPAVAISSANGGATVNLTTEGGIDYFAPAGAGAVQYQTNQDVVTKRFGGFIKETFWFEHANLSPTTFTQSSGFSLSWDPADASTNRSSASSSTDQGIFDSVAVGMGWLFRVPAGLAERTLKIYASQFSCNTELVCAIIDKSGITADSEVVSVASAAAASVVYTVAFKAASEGASLHVGLRVTAGNGGNPNIKFAAAALAFS
jgi:hypothetical protein